MPTNISVWNVEDNKFWESTGKKINDIEKDTDRNYFMSATEALEYGLIDKVLDQREAGPKKESK